jgi:hypothetical protein
MDFGDLDDFENEFQFQFYKDICRGRAASTRSLTPACDSNHMGTPGNRAARSQWQRIRVRR